LDREATSRVNDPANGGSAVGGEQELILDYASPRKRSAMRMAARSRLEWAWDDDGGGLLVCERLENQAQAVVALVGSLIPVLTMWPAALSGPVRFSPGLLFVPALVTAFWVTVALQVVQQSWGRTELRVGDGVVRLRTGGPLARRQYQWEFAQVYEVRVVPLGGQWDAWPLGEIEILAEGSTVVRLFTDHPENRLTAIAAAIRGTLEGRGRAGRTAEG
jgi:hypothetical protein